MPDEPTPQAHEPLPHRTPEEAALLRWMITCDGQAYVDRMAESLLEQARRFGDL